MGAKLGCAMIWNAVVVSYQRDRVIMAVTSVNRIGAGPWKHVGCLRVTSETWKLTVRRPLASRRASRVTHAKRRCEVPIIGTPEFNNIRITCMGSLLLEITSSSIVYLLSSPTSQLVPILALALLDYYEYALRKIYISDNPFLTPNIRKIGFLIRKDPDKVNRDLFGAVIYDTLASHKLSAATSEIYHKAKEALPFDGAIPNFKIKGSKITHSSSSGTIHTKALTIFCDKPHADFMHQLFTAFYETERNADHYVPQKLLNGGDPQHIRAYRNAIVCQNQYLDNVRVIPVIGISLKAPSRK
jgi:hypothetical protein